MFSMFKKKKVYLSSPTSGSMLPLAKVSDPVFSQGMMGPGFAIEPTIAEIYSPVKGTISTVFPTKHAIGIKSENGKDILLHIGIDTVELNGEGFEVVVKEGDTVTSENLLARVDHAYLKEQGKASTLMILFPEEKEVPAVEERVVAAKDELFELI